MGQMFHPNSVHTLYPPHLGGISGKLESLVFVCCLVTTSHRVRLFAILCTVACLALLSMGFSRQEYWGGLPFPSLEDLPNSWLPSLLHCRQILYHSLCQLGFFFFFFFYQLEANYFTILQWFLSYIDKNQPWFYMYSPIPIPSPTSLSARSLWVFPVHQVRALASCIQPGLLICFILDNIHVLMLFS